MKSVNKVEVQFVDYGNKEVVPPESVRAMKGEFLSLPKQAILCGLDQVAASGMWSDADIEAFCGRADNKSLMVLFDSFRSTEEQWKVELFEGSRSINEEFGRATGKLMPRFRSRGPPPGQKLSQSSLKPDTLSCVRAERQGAGGPGIFANQSDSSRSQRGSSTSSSISSGVSSSQPDGGYSSRSSGKSGGDAPRYGPRSGSTMATRLQELNPRLEDYFGVQVVYFQDPGRFWCVLQENVAKLDSMMDQLNDDYNSLGPGDLEPSRLRQGDVCCALYSQDSKWYRGQITMTSKSHFLVKFVDYGNEEECVAADVKELRRAYTSLPKQALCCSLSAVRPPHGTQWSDAAIEMFGDLTNCSIKKLVGCLLERCTDGSYITELIDLQSNDTIHQILISTGLAMDTEETVGQSPPRGRGLGRKLSATSTTSTVSRTSSTGKQTPPADLKYKELQLKVGQFVDVSVEFSASPSSFWCQLTEHSGRLSSLMEQLEKEYSALQALDLGIQNPEPNQVCCARYTEDDAWYRGLILKVNIPNVTVKFVDYGNTETMNISRIKQLDRQFTSLPAQAVKCSLYGIDCQRGKWVAEDNQKFEQLTVGKHMVAKVVSKTRNGVHMMNLADVSDGGELSINESLVKMGIAIRAGSPVSISMPEKKSQKSPSPPAPALPSRAQSYRDMQIPVGQRHLAVASWFNSPAEFFCQLGQSENNIMRMAESLYSSYHHLRLNDMPLRKPDVGQLCVAYYEDDGNWYRGQIVSKESVSAHIFYVDYGNIERIPLSKIKEMKPEFLELPCQALRCEVQGIGNLRGKYSPGALEKFRSLLQTPFMLTVVERIGDINVVKLVDQQGCDLAEVAGLVKPAPIASHFQASTVDPVRASPPRLQPAPQSPVPEHMPGFAFRDLDLPLKSKNQVRVSHVEDPHHFYCQLADSLTELKECMFKLSKHYMGKPAGSFTPAVGKACVAQCMEDNMWYRATVTDVPSVTETRVLFVDYGNTEKLPTSRVRPLVTEFQSLSVQAFKCCLAGLTKDLPPDSRQLFKEMSPAEVKWTCTVDSKTEGCYSVTLAHNNNCLNAQMIGRYGGEMAAVEKTTPLTQITPAPGSTSRKFAPAEIPDCKASAYLTATIDPTQFYVQLVGTDTAAQSLAEKLLADYEALGPQDHAVSDIIVGQACIAKFSEDEAWYRAYITAVTGDTSTVCFIDYGNSESVSIANIKQPMADYMDIPAMAIECRLNVDRPAGGWSEADVAKLASLTENGDKVLEVEFLGTSTPCAVRLWDGDLDLTTKFEMTPPTTKQDVLGRVPQDTAKDAAKEWTGARYPDYCVPTSKCQVYVTHIESPVEVYLQFVRQEGLLQELMDQVEEKCDNLEENDKKLTTPQLYQPCCVKSSKDQVWYRARILQWHHDEKVKVQFVDYGKSETTTLDNIKEIHPTLLKTAPMAVMTSLQGLVTPSKGWPDDVIDKLVEMTTDKVLSAEFCEDATTKLCKVQLTDKDVSVNHRMAELCPAASQPEPMPTEPSEKRGQSSGTFPDPDIPTGPVEVFVSAVESPGQFFIQLATRDQELQDFATRVSNAYTSDLSQFGLATFIPDHICCAKYSEDDQWYRGLMKSKEGDVCTVLFVDYGNVEELPMSSVANLMAEFVQVPPYAIECRLSGLESGLEWSDSEVEKFTGATMDKELHATFVAGGSKPNEVELKDGDFNLRLLFEDRLDKAAAAAVDDAKAEVKDAAERTVETVMTDQKAAAAVRSGAGDAAADVDTQTVSAGRADLHKGHLYCFLECAEHADWDIEII